MAETIVLYSAEGHLNTMSLLAQYITKNHPTISVVILSTAAAAAISAAAPPGTYHRLATPDLPSTLIPGTLEHSLEIPRRNNSNLLQALQEISCKSKIKALIMDFFCNPGFEISKNLNIPTYFYVSSGAFTLCVLIYLPIIDKIIPGNISDFNYFIDVPGCPPIYSSDFSKAISRRETDTYKHFIKSSINMQKSNGIIVNSFDALEYRAKEALSNGLCIPNAPTPPVYFMGPLISENNNGVKHECLQWLDLQPSKSVIFLCFGRRGLLSARQLKETAKGLENSGHRFLWSVRNNPPLTHNEDLDGFIERTKDRGLVVRSWAPQKEVLSHDSVAGFVTHCGRSSVLEAVSFGVPMIAWPMYAEQGMNRRFMVDEMKVAVPLAEAEDGLVTAAELEKRVGELMDPKIVRDIRHRLGELRIAAKAATGKNGSSNVALNKLIESMTRE